MVDLLRIRDALGNRRDEETVSLRVGDVLALVRHCEDTDDYDEISDERNGWERKHEELEKGFTDLEADVEKVRDELAEARREIAELNAALAETMVAA